MNEHLLYFLAGLTDDQQVPALELGEGSVNFYPDEEGYLVNYPGRTDWFLRGVDLPSYRGSPPSTGTDITRIITFRDVRGKEHIVFVRGATLCETVGNGFKVLHTFLGTDYNGKYFPDLFIHESKLIIVNWGDPVLMWDGIEGVHPLGVQETPVPPEPKEGPAPFTEETAAQGHGPWKYRTWWWPGLKPGSGPSDCYGANGSTRVWGLYELVVQFFDKYGNHGRVSPPSRIIEVKPTIEITSNNEAPIYYSDDPVWNSSHYLTVDWYPPLTEAHIVGVRVGRTLNLNMDGGAGERGVYFSEYIAEDVTSGRATLRSTDGTLAGFTPIDVTVHGPTQATGGCSGLGRIFLWGHEDPYILTWSDLALFGQFRGTNEYRAHDHVKRGIMLGDRMVVISRSSTEVLWDSSVSMAILEQDFANGSLHGRSFVDVGGAIFGLWNRGFGFFDGQKHTYVDTPYFVRSLYLDSNFYVNSARKWNDWYIMSIRKDMETTANNFLLCYNLKTLQWYLLEEKVYDLTVWKDTLLGCDDSIYELFKGRFPRQAIVYVKGFIPPRSSPLNRRNLVDLRLLMEASSVDTLGLIVEGEFPEQEAKSTDDLNTMPSLQAAAARRFPVPHWKASYLYADTPYWMAPRDFWISCKLLKPMAGYYHNIKLTFPVGHLVRLKALGVTFSEDERSSPR